MSSADYQAFVQSEIEECKRRASVYQGTLPESDPVSEHMSIDHLDALLSGPLTQDLRTIYLKEYDEIRSSIRAIALVNMSRKDFYDNASQEMILDRERLAKSSSINQSSVTSYKRDAPKEFVKKLEEQESEYRDRKSQVIDRVKAENNSASKGLGDKDMLKKAMSAVDGVSGKGISTGRKEIS